MSGTKGTNEGNLRLDKTASAAPDGGVPHAPYWLDALVESAARLCNARDAEIFQVFGNNLRLVDRAPHSSRNSERRVRLKIASVAIARV